MRPVNEKLAADLLEAGKQEFLEKGFQGASMRGDCIQTVCDNRCTVPLLHR